MRWASSFKNLRFLWFRKNDLGNSWEQSRRGIDEFGAGFLCYRFFRLAFVFQPGLNVFLGLFFGGFRIFNDLFLRLIWAFQFFDLGLDAGLSSSPLARRKSRSASARRSLKDCRIRLRANHLSASILRNFCHPVFEFPCEIYPTGGCLDRNGFRRLCVIERDNWFLVFQRPCPFVLAHGALAVLSFVITKTMHLQDLIPSAS